VYERSLLTAIIPDMVILDPWLYDDLGWPCGSCMSNNICIILIIGALKLTLVHMGHGYSECVRCSTSNAKNLDMPYEVMAH